MNPVDSSTGVTPARTDPRGEADKRAGRADGPSTGEGNTVAAGSRSAGESVSLTDTAEQLVQLEEQLRALPVVDQARVDALRQAIASGSYEVDADAVADSLLQSDRELA